MKYDLKNSAYLDLKQKIRRHNPEAIKGQNGTILIIGGSELYCGAPYFISLAAFYTGSEMVYIFTHPDAMIPLKTMVPECIVTDIKKNFWILKRITACVVGTGLGRLDTSTIAEIRGILLYLNRLNVPIIVDGDAFNYINALGIHLLSCAILTPNVHEQSKISHNIKGVYYVLKGQADQIIYNEENYKIGPIGTLKRVCGQGDILAGIIASLVSKIDRPCMPEDVIACLVMASKLLRKSGCKAYNIKMMSLITRDILEELKSCFAEMIFFAD